MKELRVGIIGCGDISHRHMVIYSNIQKRAELLGFTARVAAVAEVRPDRLEAWGEQYAFDERDLYIDYHELLKRDDIDTIDVCVHNNLHVPIAIEAMKAGYDVYCEKPAAASYHDAKMMSDCAAKLGRKFHVQISSLMTKQTRKARSLIEDGSIGVPYYVNLEQCSARRRPGYDLPQFSKDFYSKRMAGHGPSIDMGVYVIGQILYILGMPKLKSVTGFARQAMEIDKRLIENPEGFGVEDIADGFAKFENGVGFHYLASSANNYKDYSFTYILGSKGGLELTDTDTVGGKLASRGFTGSGDRVLAPNVKYYGNMGEGDIRIDYECDYNQEIEQRTDSDMMMYNDNQIMWLAYKLGILDNSTRYNTPEIAMQQLMFSDGIFLSEELGRTIMADEILAMSPTLYIPQQEIDGKLYTFDVEF